MLLQVNFELDLLKKLVHLNDEIHVLVRFLHHYLRIWSFRIGNILAHQSNGHRLDW